jgi:hypothetical protein
VSGHREVDALQAAIREAHGLLKDLKAERREVERLVAAIPHKVAATMTAAADQAAEQLTDAFAAFAKELVVRMNRRFDRLIESMLGEAKRNRAARQPSLEELARDVASGERYLADGGPESLSELTRMLEQDNAG